jgi:hypothetical protein
MISQHCCSVYQGRFFLACDGESETIPWTIWLP